MPATISAAVLDAPDLATATHSSRSIWPAWRPAAPHPGAVGALRALLFKRRPAVGVPVGAADAGAGGVRPGRAGRAERVVHGRARRAGQPHCASAAWPPAGARGLYEHGLFEHEIGDVTFFVPVGDAAAGNLTAAGVELASPCTRAPTPSWTGPTADWQPCHGPRHRHRGPRCASRTCAPAGHPRRQHVRTEVGWPVFRTRETPRAQLREKHHDSGEHRGLRGVGPVLPAIERGLDGLVDGTHFFDLMAEDVVASTIVTIPGYRRGSRARGAGRAVPGLRGNSALDHSGDVVDLPRREASVAGPGVPTHGKAVATAGRYNNNFISVVTIVDRAVTHWRRLHEPPRGARSPHSR